MRRARQQLVGAAALGVLLLAISPPSYGGSASPPITKDRIIFAKGDALWSIASDGSDERLLVSLPRPASEVSRIKVAASGTAMLVSIAGYQAWADLSSTSEPTTLRYLPCGGGLSTSPDISADGGSVLCATQIGDRIALYQMRPAMDVSIINREAKGPLFFAGPSAGPIGFGDKNDLVTLDGSGVVSPHRPNRSMVTTADGKRAIGAYGESDIDVVYTFRLDGRATKRTLMQAARVVSSSADSAWASLQQEVDACAVRISGGQYMCWRRYEALDISSRARSLLLLREGEKRGLDIFLGSISGTKARKPSPLVQSVERVAAFWPASEEASTDEASESDDGEPGERATTEAPQ